MTSRQTDTATDRLFLDRWSPRAFDGSLMAETDLLTILDAARWAASGYNFQPWRFLYALRGEADWAAFVDLLSPTNQLWAKEASALVYLLSETTMGALDKPNYLHSFDTGAAWANLALQASMIGYHSHCMIGIEMDRIRHDLGVPEGFRIEAGVAIGRRGDPATLPEALQAREMPSGRKPLADIAYPGAFRL